MIVRQKLNPGEKGTKKMVETYGDQLVCVRYRYDVQRKRRYKTVELIVDVVQWQPSQGEAEDEADFGQIISHD